VGLTAPTHASLFTGLHPFTHGLRHNGLALGDEQVTLAEFLAARGYQTAAVVSSFVLARRFGFAQGFAAYDDAFAPGEATLELAEWEGHAVAEGFDRRADHSARRAIDWLRARRDSARPFFLFLHLFDPHAPYTPPAREAERFGAHAEEDLPREIALYDAEIAFADAALGALLDALDELGLAQQTLVLVTADHGEGLMQRGYMLHGVSVHEEELRVPLVLRWPGEVPAGLVLAEPVSLLDVLPTLAELLGSRGGAFEGRSFAAALRRGGGLDPARPLFLYRRDFGPRALAPALFSVGGAPAEAAPIAVAGPHYALREGRFKYVLAPEEAPPALYDLEADPGERANAAPQHPEQAARLRERLDAWLAARPAPAPPAREPTAEERARLRALGYTE
jgi:arylsulfatase A-like enzyme